MRAHSIYSVLGIYFLIILLLSACAGSTPTATSVEGKPEWQLIPVYMEVNKQTEREGWKNYYVEFALQNTGSAAGFFGKLNNAGATGINAEVVTKEGFTYPVFIGSRGGLYAPAGFTVLTSMSGDSIRGRFDIPESATVEEITFPLGEIKAAINLDVVTPRSALTLPTSLPKTQFQNFPVIEEVPGQYRVTYSLSDLEHGDKFITAAFESLNAGYDVPLPKLWDCYIIDQRGHLSEMKSTLIENRVIPPGKTTKVQFELGTTFFKNAKAVCSVTDLESEMITEKGIFNLD